MIVEQAVYRDGVRVPAANPPLGSGRWSGADGEIAWLGLATPTDEEIDAIGSAFDLHELAVGDARHAHQRAKLERYGDMIFCVLRPARYHDDFEIVEFGELHVFAGPDFVVTVRHGKTPKLDRVREQLESRPDLLRRGAIAIVHAVLDRVVDDYAPVLAGLQNDIDEIEDEIFTGSADPSKRIYELIREVTSCQRATTPLIAMLRGLLADERIEQDERRYLRDVLDHAQGVCESVSDFRALLQSLLDINLTLETKALTEASVAQAHEARRLAELSIDQNEEIKKISGWAAILFAPTLVGTIYGMNFKHMPELDWRFGYPMAVGLMLSCSVTLYLVFRRRGWI